MSPSTLPLGDPVPADGILPAQAAAGAADRPFSAYVHVPYCRVRCGYCDFNTYTASELGTTSRVQYADEVCSEIDFAKSVLESSAVANRPLATVFFGGGTPTLLPAGDLAKILKRLKDNWSIVPNAEITTEANPDSVDFEYLQALKKAGFTRVSFGMQSAVSQTLQTLERTHSPERVPLVVAWAKEVGLQVSVDLIYGAPGETLEQWQRSVAAALEMDPHHISAYALIVEPGTKMAAQIKRGVYEMPDDDLHAQMYEYADSAFGAAGYNWYEISNWAKKPSLRSAHNLAYWQGADWWGFGPGAHSHVGGVRWWNVKHPRAYAQRVRQKVSPGYGREVLSAETRRIERVLLETRIVDGLAKEVLTAEERKRLGGLVADGLLDARELIKRGRIVPTLRGRLLADTVVNRILG